MSQNRTQKPAGKPKTRFTRLQEQQQFGATRQAYESSAYKVASGLMLAWTVLWIALALFIPQAAVWILVLWVVGCSALTGAMVKVEMTKRQSRRYLSVQKPLAELYAMNALDFEHAVARKLELSGFSRVQVTQAMGDGGIDIFAEKAGKRYAVQCKKWRPESFVPIDTLRAFVYAYRRAKTDAGIFVTTAQFSDYARREMAQEGVILMDGASLVQE